MVAVRGSSKESAEEVLARWLQEMLSLRRKWKWTQIEREAALEAASKAAAAWLE